MGKAGGTPEGAQRAMETLQAKYGTTSDGKSAYHVAIGKLGGSTPKKKPSGFAADPERASRAGKIGGHLSKRKPAQKKETT